MVGYTQEETLTPHHKIIAGCLSGAVTRFITQPLDVIKLHTQLHKRKSLTHRRRLWKVGLKMYLREGPMAFWHGHVLGQVYTVLAIGCQFYVYELSTLFVANTEIGKEHKTIMNFLCGIFGGVCSATLVIPLEVIRVRQMVDNVQYHGIWNGAKMVYKSGGIFSFYEGLTATWLQVGPQVGISFGIFRAVQPLILDFLANRDCPKGVCAPGTPTKPEHLVLASTIAGSMAGFISKTMTYPFDLAKRRMQISSYRPNKEVELPGTWKNLQKCSNLTECITKTLRREGIVGLYRGWMVTVYKSQLAGVIAFTTYELICFFLRDMS